MKSFTSFFTEARVSQASQQAERRGLTGDGHGNWMDKEGNIVAKTEQGRLVLLDKKVKAPQQEAPKKVSCLLYTSPSPRDTALSRMPSSA